MAAADDFDAKAQIWLDCWSRLADPARRRLLELTGVGVGTSLLDIGCGSGELSLLAAQRGAAVSGIDAAENMINLARRAVPAADLRVADMAELPWPDDTFDVVVAVNAFQFADDIMVPIAEAVRVGKPDGLLAICNWAQRDRQDMVTIDLAINALDPADPGPPQRHPDFREPGALQRLVDSAGLRPADAGEIDIPFDLPNEAELQHAFSFDVPTELPAGVTADVVRRTIAEAAARFRLPDGSYRLHNVFRYLIAVPAAN
jgi:SAM-dependent methyltransferase